MKGSRRGKNCKPCCSIAAFRPLAETSLFLSFVHGSLLGSSVWENLYQRVRNVVEWREGYGGSRRKEEAVNMTCAREGGLCILRN